MSKYFKVCDDYQLQNSTRVQLENNEWHIICNIIIIFCCCCFLDGLIKWLHCLETLLWTFGGLLLTGLIQQTVRVWKVPLVVFWFTKIQYLHSLVHQLLACIADGIPTSFPGTLIFGSWEGDWLRGWVIFCTGGAILFSHGLNPWGNSQVEIQLDSSPFHGALPLVFTVLWPKQNHSCT